MENTQTPADNNHLSDEIDSENDRKKMVPEFTTLDLPDATEIPGQEHIHPPALGELADTTSSSADEEGEDVFGDELVNDEDGNVTAEEKFDLEKSFSDQPGDDEKLRSAALDDTDEDGTPLNEQSFNKNITASDLDIPGAGLDDDMEAIGEEDEENNDYSLGGDNDKIPEDEF